MNLLTSLKRFTAPTARWFSTLNTQLKLALTPHQRSLTPAALAWLRSDDPPVSSPTLQSAFHQSTWIYACITTLAETVSAIPFRILTGPDDNERVLQSGAVVELFNRPNPHMDRFHFWELIISWLALRGEAFILSSRPAPPSTINSNKPSTLLVLNPDCLREVIFDGELAGWRCSHFVPNASGADSSETVFLPEELIHIKLPNPFDRWRGMSPLTVAFLAAQTDYSAAQFMKGTMFNNADTGLLITTDQQLSPEQIEQTKAALRERKRAAGTADRPLFLFGGARIEKPSISAVDLQFLENRKFNRQEICAIFKVPQELLGFTEDANRSVSDAARLNFMENRIAPLCKRLEAAFDPLIQRFGRDLRGEFHIKGTPIMQSAQRARIDTALKLFGVGVPLNIINHTLDLGLPQLPHGQTCYLPQNLQEVGQASRPSPENLRNVGAVRPELPASPPKRLPAPDDVIARCDALLQLLGHYDQL
jgi:HK97 family phage portal protein